MHSTHQPQLPSLSVSCVFYDTDTTIYLRTLTTLATAIAYAKNKQNIECAELHLINNNPEKEQIFLDATQSIAEHFNNIIIHNGQGNIGYGLGNNLAIEKTTHQYHLVLNPDVELAQDSLYEGIKYLEANPQVSLVAPQATNTSGETEFLAKRMPSLLVLLLRALNKPPLNKIFKKALDTYAYKDKIPSREPLEIELASGCFMLCRTSTLQTCKGFSDKYFLYFEDFDLTKRMSKIGKVIYLPQMNICHLGGNAHTKGLAHTKLFLSSYFIFAKKPINEHQ